MSEILLLVWAFASVGVFVFALGSGERVSTAVAQTCVWPLALAFLLAYWAFIGAGRLLDWATGRPS